MKVKLGDITKIRTGRQEANAASADGEYPLFTCSRESLRISSYSYECECVLVAGNGDLNVKYYNGKFDAYQRTYIIESKQSNILYMPYLYYFMEKYIVELRQLAIGGVIKYIKLGNLTEALIELPSYAEQQALVERLSKVKSVIDRRNEQIKKLDELVKSRFAEMFGDMRRNNKGWQSKTLGEACDVRDGTHDSPKYHAQGYPLVTSKNVTQGSIDFSGCNLISKEDYIKICKRSKVDKGDIIMPMIGTIGCPVIVASDAEFAIKNVALIKFPPTSTLLNVFVKHLLLSSYFETEVMGKARGGTQKFISLSDIRKLKVHVPPAELQNAFALFVSHVDTLRSAIRRSMEETQKLFDSLMQKYFD